MFKWFPFLEQLQINAEKTLEEAITMFSLITIVKLKEISLVYWFV